MHLTFNSSTFIECIGNSATLFYAPLESLGYVDFYNCIFIEKTDLDYEG